MMNHKFINEKYQIRRWTRECTKGTYVEKIQPTLEVINVDSLFTYSLSRGTSLLIHVRQCTVDMSNVMF